MVDRAEGANPGFEECIRQPAIVVDTFLIHRAGARGLDTRPGSREPVALLVQSLQDGDVFLIAVVLVAGDVSSGGAFDSPHSMREAIPVGFAFSVGVPRTLDLICGGGHAPKKAIGKMCHAARW